MQRNEGKRHQNGEICELTVPNSEHKGSRHRLEHCHQWVVLLIARWCLGVSRQHCTYLCTILSYLILPNLTKT